MRSVGVSPMKRSVKCTFSLGVHLTLLPAIVGMLFMKEPISSMAGSGSATAMNRRCVRETSGGSGSPTRRGHDGSLPDGSR